MPTYEYECRKCGLHFEKFQTITAKPVRRCPKCKGTVRRLLGAGAAIISKGGAAPEAGGATPPRCPMAEKCDRDAPCRLRE